jgi:multidrug efflux pump
MLERLRPILVTSLAFIARAEPLVIAHGAGSELRQSLGTTVYSGMLGVTLFDLLTPAFYTVVRKLSLKARPPKQLHRQSRFFALPIDRH